MKLYETLPGDSMRYLALSHPWGRPPHFCTFRNNLSAYKRSIDFDQLPATFKDAVTVTRELGIRYLWIDSICIIQGADGDFSQQAQRMEDVFSQAYCVLAASSATGQGDGFLHPRSKRRSVQFRRSDRPAICVGEFIDNFDQYVLQSPLNKRGWVLQERALARRTIYFTSEQTFWECGSGVQCETMTKMNKYAPGNNRALVFIFADHSSASTLASFLGDPVFPKVAMDSSRGGKIRLYQDLYARYSRLALSHQEDRPVAIAGLEKRLVKSFGVHGGFGVLDDDSLGLLRRSLLWCRGFDQPSLQRIDFKEHERQQTSHLIPPPPSWSWMAYRGGVDYLDLPFDNVDWEGHDILSPWSTAQPGTWYSSNSGRHGARISVIARTFDLETMKRSDSNLIFDTPSESKTFISSLKCVILGKMKKSLRPEHERLHYVLLVSPVPSQGRHGRIMYERVGVGYMPGHLIHVDEPALLAMVY